MKVRWLVLSLALVAVAALAAVVFSSQGSEASNGLSKGILYQLMEFFGIEITAESNNPRIKETTRVAPPPSVGKRKARICL